MANSFLSGFAGGAELGLRLRDYDENRERQKVADRRAQESHDLNMRRGGLQLDQAQSELQRTQDIRDLTAMEYALMTGAMDSPQFRKNYRRMFGHYGGDDERAFSDIEELERAASSGDADRETAAAFTRVYADEINKGGPKDSYKEVVDFWPTEDGIVPELAVTRASGEKYRAPATQPNRDETDDDVMVIPWGQLFTDLKARKKMLELVRARRVGLGDSAPLTALQTAEAEAAKRKQGLEDFMFKEQYKNSLGGSADWSVTSLGDGQFVMFNKRTGERRLPTQEEMAALSSGGAPGQGGLDATAYSNIRQAMTTLFTRVDPNGNIFVPEGADTEMAESLKLSEALAERGVSLFDAVDLAYNAVRGPVSESQALEEARQEAAKLKGNFGSQIMREVRDGEDPFNGASEGKWVENRVREIVESSRTAQREVQRILGGEQQGFGSPVGQQPGQQPRVQAVVTADEVRRARSDPNAYREGLRRMNPDASQDDIEAMVRKRFPQSSTGVAAGAIER